MLSDVDILHARDLLELDIYPWNDEQLQPASYDLTLKDTFLIHIPQPASLERSIDVSMLGNLPTWTTIRTQVYDLSPGQLVLGCTRESVTLSRALAGKIEGRSSLGRVGLMVHVTAGFVDPGWQGQLTLEMFNLAPWPIALRAGMGISQMGFHRLDTPSEHVYGDETLKNRYADNPSGPVGARPRLG